MEPDTVELTPGTPEQTNNGTRPEDGPQFVSQDPNVDYTEGFGQYPVAEEVCDGCNDETGS